MVATSLITTLLFASVIAAIGKPVVNHSKMSTKMSLTKRIWHSAKSAATIPEKDRRRIQHRMAKASKRSLQDDTSNDSTNGTAESTPADNMATSYTVLISVGNPPTSYSVVFDTGSANSWVGGNPDKPYVVTNTSIPTGNNVSVTYGLGNFSGIEYIDRVILGQDLAITGQSLGAALVSHGFNKMDGILGLGPQALTSGSLSPNRTTTIPTVTDNLFSEGTIPMNLIGVYFAPLTNSSDMNGEITWGGIDETKNISDIVFVPRTTVSPASHYWGVDASISYGSTSLLIGSGIVDTGTTLFLIATEAYNTYKSATGAVLDSFTGLLTITLEQFESLQSMFINVSGIQLEITANAQIWPRDQNHNLNSNSSPNQIYLVVGNIDNNTETPEFVIGQVVLERFYSVFDTANERVGFATTSFTNATTN